MNGLLSAQECHLSPHWWTGGTRSRDVPVSGSWTFLELQVKTTLCWVRMQKKLEAIALRLEAIATRLEAIAIRLLLLFSSQTSI